MSRTEMIAAKAAAVLALNVLMIGQAGAGTLERALACQLTPAKLPALMTSLRAEVSGFKKPVAKLGMPTLDLFKLEAPVEAHGFTADEVVVAPTRTALVLRGKTSAELAVAMKLQRTPADQTDMDANPFAPWTRDVQPRYASLVAYQSSHHRLQDAAMLGCQYAHNHAALWPDDVTDAQMLKLLQGTANVPKPKK